MIEIHVGDILRIKKLNYEVVLSEGILKIKCNAGWRDKDVYCLQPLADVLTLNTSVKIISNIYENPGLNKQYDIEAGEFVEELGNNGEELKDYPDDDPMEEDRNEK